MKPGDTVYWISSDRLNWGTVVHLTTALNGNGKPKQAIVDRDGELRLFDSLHASSELYDTAQQAFADGMIQARKRQQSAFDMMSRLMDDLDKAAKELVAKDVVTE